MPIKLHQHAVGCPLGLFEASWWILLDVLTLSALRELPYGAGTAQPWRKSPRIHSVPYVRLCMPRLPAPAVKPFASFRVYSAAKAAEVPRTCSPNGGYL